MVQELFTTAMEKMRKFEFNTPKDTKRHQAVGNMAAPKSPSGAEVRSMPQVPRLGARVDTGGPFEYLH